MALVGVLGCISCSVDIKARASPVLDMGHRRGQEVVLVDRCWEMGTG